MKRKTEPLKGNMLFLCWSIDSCWTPRLVRTRTCPLLSSPHSRCAVNFCHLNQGSAALLSKCSPCVCLKLFTLSPPVFANMSVSGGWWLTVEKIRGISKGISWKITIFEKRRGRCVYYIKTTLFWSHKLLVRLSPQRKERQCDRGQCAHLPRTRPRPNWSPLGLCVTLPSNSARASHKVMLTILLLPEHFSVTEFSLLWCECATFDVLSQLKRFKNQRWKREFG